MIGSITFRSGYPTRLRGIGTRRIEFNPRLNILYGPNGSGKTTILRALATATGCARGGWPTDTALVSYEESFLDSGYLEQHAQPVSLVVLWG